MRQSINKKNKSNIEWIFSMYKGGTVDKWLTIQRWWMPSGNKYTCYKEKGEARIWGSEKKSRHSEKHKHGTEGKEVVQLRAWKKKAIKKTRQDTDCRWKTQSRIPREDKFHYEGISSSTTRQGQWRSQWCEQRDVLRTYW